MMSFHRLFFLMIFHYKFCFNIKASSNCHDWLNKHFFNSTENHNGNLNNALFIIDNFDDLNIYCDQIKIYVEFAIIFSKRRIFFPNDLDLRPFLEMVYFPLENAEVQRIFFHNIKGFNQKSFNKYINPYANNYVVYFNNLDFKFYLNESPITKDVCFKSYFDQKSTNVFGSLKKLYFGDKIFYSKEICPFVFMNTLLNELHLYQIINSLIFKNQLEFLEINETESFDLKTQNLFLLRVQVVFDTISLRLINRFVFRNVVVLYITGQIFDIQSDLFTVIKKVK